MQIVTLNTKLTLEERETQLNYDFINKTWTMDSTVKKHYNKALQKGWQPLIEYVYDDGTVAGYMLIAPDRAITIRSIEKKVISKKQKLNLNSRENDG